MVRRARGAEHSKATTSLAGLGRTGGSLRPPPGYRQCRVATPRACSRFDAGGAIAGDPQARRAYSATTRTNFHPSFALPMRIMKPPDLAAVISGVLTPPAGPDFTVPTIRHLPLSHL